MSLIRSTPMFDSFEIIRAAAVTGVPKASAISSQQTENVCECVHTSFQHADIDCDCDENGFFPLPRICLVDGCTCADFFEEYS